MSLPNPTSKDAKVMQVFQRSSFFGGILMHLQALPLPSEYGAPLLPGTYRVVWELGGVRYAIETIDELKRCRDEHGRAEHPGERPEAVPLAKIFAALMGPQRVVELSSLYVGYLPARLECRLVAPAIVDSVLKFVAVRSISTERHWLEFTEVEVALVGLVARNTVLGSGGV